MDRQVYHDALGRPYVVKDGVSQWVEPGLKPVPSGPVLEYVGFGPRFGARVVDMVLIYVISFVTNILAGFAIGLVLVLLGKDVSLYAPRLGQLTAVSFVLALAAAVVYELFAEGIHGSTPGKMALGLTVRSEDGGPCGMGQALKRSLAYYIDGLFVGVPALLSMQKSPTQQRIGDKWARTVVVRTRSLQPDQRRSGLTFAWATAAALFGYAAVAVLSLLLKL